MTPFIAPDNATVEPHTQAATDTIVQWQYDLGTVGSDRRPAQDPGPLPPPALDLARRMGARVALVHDGIADDRLWRLLSWPARRAPVRPRPPAIAPPRPRGGRVSACHGRRRTYNRIIGARPNTAAA